MDSAACQLFSGSGLSCDQHSEVRGGNAVENPKDFSHRDTAPHQVLKSVFLGRLDLNHFFVGGEDHLRTSNTEPGVGRQEDFLDSHRSQERSVGGAQISEDGSVSGADNLCVATRDRGVGEGHIAGPKRAEANDILFKVPLLAGFCPLDTRDSRSPDMDLARV